MFKIKIRYDSYSWFQLLLVFIWGHFFLFDFVKVVLRMFPYGDIFADIIMNLIYFITVCMSLPYIVTNIKYKDIILYLIITTVFFANILFHPSFMGYIESKMAHFLLIMLPMYFVGISFNVKDNTYLLYKVSLINMVLQLIYQVFFREPMTEVQSLYQGDMDVAYKILPHICLIMMFALEKINFINLIFSILGFVLLISSGTRGALFILAVFLLCYCILIKRVKKPLISYPIIIAIITAIMINADRLFFMLFDIANRLGLSIRIFTRVLEGNFFTSHGRNVIRDQLMEALKEKPITGYGIGADYYIAGNYAHNLLLELCISFGLIIGILLTLWLLHIVIKSYCVSDSNTEKGIIMLFSASIFLKLMLSGTYLDEYMFFLAIGIMVNIIRKRCLGKL